MDDGPRIHRVNQSFSSGSLLNSSISAWPNASIAGWYQLQMVIVNTMAFHLGGKTCLCSASIITLTPRSLAWAHILFRSSYSPFRSLMSCSIKGDPVRWSVPSCKTSRSVESGVPGNETGSDNIGREATRCEERLRSASVRGKRAVYDTQGHKLVIHADIIPLLRTHKFHTNTCRSPMFSRPPNDIVLKSSSSVNTTNNFFHKTFVDRLFAGSISEQISTAVC